MALLYRFWTLRSVLLVAALASPTLALAQVGASMAQLSGVVRDQSGGTIGRALVSVRNVETNLLQNGVANEGGRYLFSNLTPGSYELSAQFTGFARYTQKGIVLTVGQQATVDVALEVATVGQDIVVTAEVPIIEPSRSEISEVVETKLIQSLPISSRLFTDFALLTPGVATGRSSLQSTFTDPTTTRISFAGQRDFNNSVTIDGADNIHTGTGSQRATPSPEAVSEFRVVNNSFGADQGRALGGIVNIVTKSGTNTFHGSVYDFFQNSATNARTSLTLPDFFELRQNQYGATLGGPIQKDKTFFFMNYEGQRRAQSPTYPTMLVSNIGAINAMKTSIGLGPENLNVLKTADYDQGFLKVDRIFSQEHRLTLRYAAIDSTNLNMLVGDTLDGGGIGGPSTGRNGLLRDQSVVGILTSSVTPTLVNTLLGQYARRNYGFPGVSNEPDLMVANLVNFGHNFGAFERLNEWRVQFQDTLAWTHGKHLIQTGFDSNIIQDFVISPNFTPAHIVFASLPGMLASARPLWGRTPCPAPLAPVFTSPCPVSFAWSTPVGTGPVDLNGSTPALPTDWQLAYRPEDLHDYSRNVNHQYWGMFFQDQIRLTQRLTLNLGLRYDLETGLGYFLDADRKEFQPRIGIAYSPTPKTVIRAGYGIFYDKYNLTFFFLAGLQRPPILPGFPVTNSHTGGTYVPNQMSLGGPSPVPPFPVTPAGSAQQSILQDAFTNLLTRGTFPQNQPHFQGGVAVDRAMRAPYSQQTSFEINQQIGSSLSIGAGYRFVAAHKLVRNQLLAVSDPIGVFPGTGKYMYDYGVEIPGFSAPPGGKPGSSFGLAWLDGSGNSAYHGGTLQLSQRFSSVFQVGANYTFSKVLDDGTYITFVSIPQSLRQRELERALSNQDVRHRFVANFTADAPQSSFLRNFQLSGIVTMQSPRRFSIFAGFDANHDGNPVTDRVGELARNTYQGDKLQTVDLRLTRRFKFTDRTSMRLSVDAFNVLNTVNVDEVFGVYGAPDLLGPVPNRYGDGIGSPANPFFGQPRTMFNPRQFQFSAKIEF